MGYLVITESEKFDILKRYGLLVEQEEFYYDSLGKKYPQSNKAREEWDDVIKAIYEPRFKIPYTDIKISAIDVTTIITTFIPYGLIISAILDASSAAYFINKGDYYEGGLRVLFLGLPIRNLPIVRKLGKNAMIRCLLDLKNISKDINYIGKLTKEKLINIFYIFKYFLQNRQTILIALKTTRLIIDAMYKLNKLLSEVALTPRKIIIKLYNLYKKEPKSVFFQNKYSKLLINIVSILGEGYLYVKTWDELWNKFATEEMKDNKFVNENITDKEELLNNIKYHYQYIENPNQINSLIDSSYTLQK